jgi:hypothetical protein
MIPLIFRLLLQQRLYWAWQTHGIMAARPPAWPQKHPRLPGAPALRLQACRDNAQSLPITPKVYIALFG